MKSDIVLAPFDHQYLVDNQIVLQNLCDVYCSIWERDEHFAEYRKCPSCGRYFSYGEVEQQGVAECVQCSVQLVIVWSPVSVGLTLMGLAKHHSFSGALLLQDERVIGFSWGKLYSDRELPYFYLAELGVVFEFRRKGFGKRLVKQVLIRPFCRYPNVIGMLSTHQDSPAVFLFEDLGYSRVVDYPAKQGRIRMSIARIGDVRMFE